MTGRPPLGLGGSAEAVVVALIVAIVVVAAGCTSGSGRAELGSAATAPTSSPSSTETPGGTAAVSTTPTTPAAAAGGGAVPPGVEPRADLTPGAADPRVTQANIGSTICVSGYTRTVRPPESVTGPIKTRVLAAYGYTHPRSDYELDHLVPLEVGGAPADVGNLWPEPYEASGDRLAPAGMGSETKDRFENFLHREVCAGRLPLADAQREIAVDWHGSWVRAGRPSG